MIVEQTVPVVRSPGVADYGAIIGPADLAAIRAFARPLAGRRVKMLNATAVGGGTAEMLNRLVPLLTELGVDTRWDVLTGGDDFLAVTKAFHNALHGGSFEPR